MSRVTWKSPKNLGFVADDSYFEKQLTAVGNGAINYEHIAGMMPPGVELTDGGLLNGVPRILEKNGIETNKVYRFTLRATDSTNKLADRTFELTVSGVQALSTSSTFIDLGTYYDGDRIAYQFIAHDQMLASNISWKIIHGSLPNGITLSNRGLLEGFIYQNKINIDSLTQDPISNSIDIGWDQSSWDRLIFDFVQQQEDRNYQFTVEVTDGENYIRQTYTMFVVARDINTVDKTARRADQSIDISRTDVHMPFVTTRPGYLPEIKIDRARQDTYFAFKFDGIDFDNDELYFEITSPDQLGFDQDERVGWDMDEFDGGQYPMPISLGLNNYTGWYTGRLARQNEHQIDHQIQIYCRKPYDFNLKGYKSNFIISVLGKYNEIITWVTNEDLGSIDNGLLSILRVQAEHSLGKPLEYVLKSGSGRTPQGIELELNGMLSGRASFNYFQFDRDTTTFDKSKTTFEKICRFTVIARTADRSAYIEKTFTLRINTVNKKPFENLYLKALPSTDQRILFENLMRNQEIFPDNLIYRPFDPYYGKAKDLRFLFLPGINPSDLPTYVNAMEENHYNKTILFGDVKTAVAYDENFNLQYEVVYLEVIDEAEGRDPTTKLPAPSAQSIDLSKNKNQYSDGVIEYIEYTPNGLGNMSKRIIEIIGVANTNTLPGWMVSPQPDPDNPGKFLPPLGYTRGVILAYTIPGAAKLIAYRLKNSNFLFNRITFETDRYQIDNWLSKNYDINENRFISGIVTNFDLEPSVAQKYRDRGSVDYAVSSGFEELNGKSPQYVIDNGILDGMTQVVAGETLIFYQQNDFPEEVNSYIDHIIKGNLNERSAVYKITLTDTGLIKLVRERYTQPGDIVTVSKGLVYGGKRLAFEAYALHGDVPRWWKFDRALIDYPNTTDKLAQPHTDTTFDQKTTRFVSNRDRFADLDASGKYIKFPKNGVFL